VAIRRDSDQPYSSSTFLAPLDQVAGVERLLPLDWISAEANDVAEGFVRYAAPLLPKVKNYPRLETTRDRA
jgi:hypothetical protein